MLAGTAWPHAARRAGPLVTSGAWSLLAGASVTQARHVDDVRVIEVTGVQLHALPSPRMPFPGPNSASLAPPWNASFLELVGSLGSARVIIARD